MVRVLRKDGLGLHVGTGWKRTYVDDGGKRSKKHGGGENEYTETDKEAAAKPSCPANVIKTTRKEKIKPTATSLHKKKLSPEDRSAQRRMVQQKKHKEN